MNRSTDNPSTESAQQTGMEETSRQGQPGRRKSWQQPILKKLDMRETLLNLSAVNPEGPGAYS
ncbi:MAG TPA: hypothetical protein VFX11_06210 [Candidatus Kapabacteria bacterium]|nr:hypothetical protein [Candidatus Kapabacteria bacterium]